MTPAKVWTPSSSTVRGPPLSPYSKLKQGTHPQSRSVQPTFLVPVPLPPAHIIELWIWIVSSRIFSWQSLLVRIETWIVVEKFRKIPLIVVIYKLWQIIWSQRLFSKHLDFWWGVVLPELLGVCLQYAADLSSPILWRRMNKYFLATLVALHFTLVSE